MLETLETAEAAVWGTLAQMAPYLLFGFLAGGLLSVFVSPKLIERHLGGHGIWPVFKAALFGVPLPLCSCSVLPLTASLRRHGAGRGAATAFLIATPQTGVDSILATYALLGPVFAVFRPVAALVSGLLGGTAADLLEPHGAADEHEAAPCEDACCADGGGSKLIRALRYGFVDLPRDIGRPLLVGIVAAGAIAALVPADFFAHVGTGVGAIVVMMLLGIPVYVCATASIPVAAALMMKGVSPGAALAFLMTGPASNAAGIATVWKIMGARTAVVYLGAVALTALAAGLCLDSLMGDAVKTTVMHVHGMQPGVFEAVCAVVLVGVLMAALFRRAPKGHEHEQRQEGEKPCCHS